MLSIGRGKALERALPSFSFFSLPSFLVPAFPIASRPFSASTSRPSYIGQEPVSIPPEVNFTVIKPPPRKNDPSPLRLVEVEGPLGKISYPIPQYIKIDHDTETRKASITIEDRDVKKQRAMWGATRAYIQNHVLGVSEGHTAILSLVGVGYRATIENTATTVEPEFEGQQFVNLKVGYSHPIELPVPKGVKATTPQPTRILLEGREKDIIMQFAANIKKWRKPEPYKGKGIFVNGETIKLKAKKVK